MFSFFKRNKNQEPVPEWANFFTGREYRAFLAAVDHYFTGAGVPYKIDDGVVLVGENSFGYERMGLLNVAQRCLQEGMNNYQKTVDHHFDLMANSKSFQEDFEKTSETYEGAKRYLGLRIYPSDQVGAIGSDSLLSRKIAEGVHAVVVFDLPEVVVNVPPSKVEEWGMSADDLFKKGMRNIRKNYPVDISKEEIGNHELWIAVSEHFFTPNLILSLHEESKYLGSHGAIIAIPNRHTVLIYPIDSLEVVAAISDLIPVVMHLHQQGPGSITDKIFFYQDGKFTEIPYKLSDGKMQIHPPQSFVDVLNKIGG